MLLACACEDWHSGADGGSGETCEGVPSSIQCPPCTPCEPTSCDAEFTSDCATCGHGTNDCGQPCLACFEGPECTPVRDLGAGVDCTECPRLFSVAVERSGTGRIVSSPAGIDCGTTCTALFPEGTRVALAAEPHGDEAFAGWCGGAQGAAACAIVDVGADTLVGAGFGAGACTPAAPLEIRDLRFAVADEACPLARGAHLAFNVVNNTSVGVSLDHVDLAGPDGWGASLDLPCGGQCDDPLPLCLGLPVQDLPAASTANAAFDVLVGPGPPSGRYVVQLTGQLDDGTATAVSTVVGYECAPGPSPERCGCALVDCTATVLHATGVACSAGTCAYAACDGDYVDCDGDRTNGCERRGRHCGVELASGQDAWSLVLGSDTLFWIDGGGNLVRMPTTGGTPEVMLASATGTVDRNLATDGTRLYWASDVASGPGITINSLPIGGGTPQTLDAFSAYDSRVWGASNGFVYFSFEADSGAHMELQRWVARVPSTGGASTSVVQVWYFRGATTNDTQLFAIGDYTLVMTPLGGGAQTRFPDVGGEFNSDFYVDIGSSLAASADSVYVSGRIYQPWGLWVRRVYADGSGHEDVAQVSALGPMICDASSVYWADDAISTLPLVGGTPVTLVASPGIRAMAVDDTYVYWPSSDGTINRAPKN
jgi:hypothetical protein